MGQQDTTHEPHAYVVEGLWNPGSPTSERWARAMDMDDVREPLSLDDAEALRADMIADGHAPENVRIVATVVSPLTTALLTSEPALAAFREAWEQADVEGATGDRVRRGMVAAIEAVAR